MLKGGVIMDVVNVEQARIAEEAGAVEAEEKACGKKEKGANRWRTA